MVHAMALLSCVPTFSVGQSSPTQHPSQQPKTSPRTEEVLPSYEGQKVLSVELAGQPNLDTSALAPLLAQKAGQPFSQKKIDDSVAALKGLGRFQQVELELRPETEGVRVLFILHPADYFGIYRFPGATSRFSYARLLQVANYPPQGAYTPVDVRNARDALETFFRRTGYFQAQVRPELQVDKQNGLVNVFFSTTMGKRAKFGNVEIEGATPQETEHLRSVLHSFMARLRGAAIRPGKTFKPGTLKKATQYLENALMKKDRLAAQVKLVGANYNPETNRADVLFHVTTGPVVHVKVQGAHLWSWTRRSLLPVYQQNGLNPELIQEGRQNLISHFQKKGYFEVKVETREQQQADAETIFYTITKGRRHKVAEINITGNNHFSDKELMSNVKVKKGRFFSRGDFSQKLVRTSVTNLSNLYKAAGFSGVKVTPEVTGRNGNLVINFRVDEGPQDIVESLKIQGNETQPVSRLAPKGLKLQPGQAYSQQRVNEDRNRIVATYLNLGYLTATFRETVQQASNDPHRLQVTYEIDEGPQVHVANVITLGRQDTRQRVISRQTMNIQPGTPLRERDMLTDENNLYQPDIFDWAEIDPRRHITTQTMEDVVIKVHEAKKNTISYGVGFEIINRGGSVPSGTVAVPGLPPVGLPSSFKTSEKTFYGPRGTFQYTRKNLRGKAESLLLSGFAGRLDQRGSVTYTNPSFWWTNWRSDLMISGEHNSENPIFTSRIGEAGWQLQRPLNPDKTQTLFVRYQFRETGITRLLIPDLVPEPDRHVRLSTISGSYVRDTRDNPLDAHKGIYESFELEFNPSALGSSVDFARLLAQTAYYKKIPANIIWANSVRIGLQKPFAGSHVPISEAFFSGGGSTLRGFPLNGAGPQRTIPACGNPSDSSTCSLITVPVGGNELLILNSEFRIPLDAIKKNLGLVTFYDGGNVFPRIGFHGQYTNSVGFGFRYTTPVGPVRIDIGHNLNAPPGIKSTQIFVTLGQAF